MKKILFVFGTRPEAIKLAPLIKIFSDDKVNFNTLIAVTAQHREMLDQALKLFNIDPDFDLDLMSHNQSLQSLTSKILNGISDLLIEAKPDVIFVQGDTTTTLAASLAAFYQKIPVAHIEAGLRTNNIYSPFPEEINRKITTAISTYHFPPTNQSKNNLLNEGVNKKNIIVSGNTVIDALLFITNKIENNKLTNQSFFEKNYSINFSTNKIILVTGHRRESFGTGFENICLALKQIASNNDVQIIYPVHLNPNVQEPVKRLLGDINNIHLIPPQEYVPFVYLMKNANIILTDSGGVQEEAPSLGVPVLVMRDTTERYEGVESGTARLVGTKAKKIVSEIELLLNNKLEYVSMANSTNPYGDGKASSKIYKYFLSVFNY